MIDGSKMKNDASFAAFESLWLQYVKNKGISNVHLFAKLRRSNDDDGSVASVA